VTAAPVADHSDVTNGAPHERTGAIAATVPVNGRGRSGAIRLRLALPGDLLEWPLAVEGDPAGLSYAWHRVGDGVPPADVAPLVGATVHAPDVPGLYRFTLWAGRRRVPIAEAPLLGVLVPFEEKRGGHLNGYAIGTYRGERTLALGARPAGFLEVASPAEAALPVTEHLRLRDFLTHDAQGDVWPKYVALRPALLEKLELVLAEVEKRRGAFGVAESVPLAVRVNSGFRTPAHNRRIRDAADDSRHQYGDAADVVVDADGDGRTTLRDALQVAFAAELVEQAHPDLVGGIGTYTGRRNGGVAYIHLDARGTRARWRR
jgi:uncharacterized protein YcbK (DUF882 family)